MKRIAIACVRAVANVPLKIKVSFGILVFAMLMAIIKSRPDGTWCLFAVLFCFAGDIALNHTKDRRKRSSRDFMVGMVLFSIAHILYSITYFLRIYYEHSYLLESGYNWTLFLCIDCVLFLAFFSIMNENMILGKYYVAVFVYTIVIMTTFTMTFFYANSAKSISSWACLGSALLIVSDGVIAVEKFTNYETKKTRAIVWFSYVIGQLIMITFA